ncbi:hypothetical protein SLS62_002866 [Diatrype stigma]|uniref:Xylanolytic transcriptional activator regulatory domain-containing protein n=1 Tax=Diatrype stigma TaxID=117547 RepID=A0AAN9UW74_9PEZI
MASHVQTAEGARRGVTNQLQAYKDRLEALRLAKDEERDALLNEPLGSERPNGGRSLAALSPPSPESPQGIEYASNSIDNTIEEASVGADGRICFYGKTSLYHIDSKDGGADGPMLAGHDTSTEEQSPGIASTSASSFRCHDTAALLAEVPPAARYSTRQDSIEVGNHFASKALQFMLEDIGQGGSSIPTLQGLLIFSARECACGRVSQGWLYSGMAFRMMRDLGIDVSPKKLGKGHFFTEEDLALRRQVFWSCYTWDKTMSVCLGRGATVSYTVELPTVETLPFGREADDETWQPTNQASSTLVEQKSLSSTRFTAYCELCVITESVLGELYSKPHSGRHDQLMKYLDSTLRKLRSWSERLPPELFIQEPTKMALVCPPLHILLLNLMYHTVTILLCRPYRTIQRAAKEQCTKASQMIDALFVLHVKRFGFRFITYLQTYTMFVGSTINVLDFTENANPGGGGGGDGSDNAIEEEEGKKSTLAEEAKSRLYFGLEILRQATSTPSAARCAAVIAQLIQKQQKTSRQDAGQGVAAGSGLLSPIVGAEEVAATGTQQQRPSEEAPTTDFPFPAPSQPPSAAPRSQEGVVAASAIPPLSMGGTQDTETRFPPSCSIEQPLKWLPENVVDDGSWMLMTDVTVDGGFDYSSLEDFN